MTLTTLAAPPAINDVAAAVKIGKDRLVAFIYHIARAADWEQARQAGEYTMSTLDRTLAEEGFIHCSLPHQVDGVKDAYYRGVPDLVLLVIDPDLVTAPVRYDPVPGQPDPFPHIYGPLNTGAVTEVRAL